MAKGNDKRVVKQTHELLLSTLGNLLESHRERKFTKNGKPVPRKPFCADNKLVEGTVAHIETGRFLKLRPNQLRKYLATTYGRADPKFATSVRKVYDGLKELPELLKAL